MVGNDGNPELLRLAVYIGYWVVVGLHILRSSRERSYQLDGVAASHVGFW